MRAIDVHTLKLTNIDPEKVPYAILSHTWGPEELSFQEWEHIRPSGAILNQCPHAITPESVANIKGKQGFDKILGACERAKQDGLNYLWCDTNCIDKTSSAELDEAINSMFAWYRDSTVCYAYLTDVNVPKRDSCRPKGYSWGRAWFYRHYDDKRADGDTWHQFQKSRWWTRGWTLQELLAPVRVVFFALDWTPLGTKEETARYIASFTTIHKEALENRDSISNFSVAQRMSWAAYRQTTRGEDTAYCLLGIFGVQMPIIYSQGHGAFLTLQREIIGNSDDHSILAWDCLDNSGAPVTTALAESPANFRDCGSIVRPRLRRPSPSSVTNTGVSISLPTLETTSSSSILGGLNCLVEFHSGSNATVRQFPIWIPLHRVTGNIFVKCHVPSSKVLLQQSYAAMSNAQQLEMFISHDPHHVLSRRMPLLPALSLHACRAIGSDGITLTMSCGRFNVAARIFLSLSNLKAYRVLGLGSREPLQMSHRFVSTNRHTTIVSVAWDTRREPCRWLITTIQDQGMRSVGSMIGSTEWRARFEQPRRNQENGRPEIEAALTDLHGRIRNTYRQESDGIIPLTMVEERTSEDLRGLKEIIVDFIMRE